ncbi:hypothetical protein [Bombiscardovia coagulans]|nr:hypothetical protein [Bombiscardovia coagulans]
MDSLLADFLFWKHEWAWMALELFFCALSIYLIVFELRNSYVLVESGHIEVGYNMEIINSHKERYKHKAKEIA